MKGSGFEVGRQGGLGRPLGEVLRAHADAPTPPHLDGSPNDRGPAISEFGALLVADLASNDSGLAVVYEALDRLVEQFSLSDAAMVLEEPGLGRQVFRSGRRRIDAGDLALLDAEPGLYTDPPLDDPSVDPTLLTSLCTVALRLDLLRHDSWYDSLTGLYDRRSFQRLLEMSVARSERYGWPFTLVILDLDYLKSINDNQGHGSGDAALVAIADRLRLSLRHGDNAARIGGDEFALIMPNTKLSDVGPLLERAAQTSIDGDRCPGFSYGAAESPSEGETGEALCALADQRLRAAKGARP